MNRGRQIIRQWKALRILESSRLGYTVAQLHEEMDENISLRTLYRDLEQLQEAGFPLLRSDERWRVLRVGEGAWTVPIRPTELMALILAEDLMAPVRDSMLFGPLAEIRSRLMALLSPTGRAYIRAFKSSAVATLFAPGHYRERSEQIDTIREAIDKQQVLRIVHTSPGREPLERFVEPYSTWYHAGLLYLIAFCRRAGDVRTFAVNRIGEAEITQQVFDPDQRFDPSAFTRKGFGVYHGPTYRYVIDFSPRWAHLLNERRYHHTQRVYEREDGWVRLTMEAAGLPEVASWVAGFGGHVRPVAPSELVQRVKAIHEGGLSVLTE